MTKLSRVEMKSVAGGSTKTQWSCYGSSYMGTVTTCSDFDPTTLCEGCGYSSCVNTHVSCNGNTLCVC